jgi:hypothetical protein
MHIIDNSIHLQHNVDANNEEEPETLLTVKVDSAHPAIGHLAVVTWLPDERLPLPIQLILMVRRSTVWETPARDSNGLNIQMLTTKTSKTHLWIALPVESGRKMLAWRKTGHADSPLCQ